MPNSSTVTVLLVAKKNLKFNFVLLKVHGDCAVVFCPLVIEFDPILRIFFSKAPIQYQRNILVKFHSNRKKITGKSAVHKILMK